MGELQSIGWFVNWYKPKVSKTTFEFSATFQVLGVLNREPEIFFSVRGVGGFPPNSAKLHPLRRGVKKTVFLLSVKKGRGVSANPKHPYQKILKIFSCPGQLNR